MKFIKFTGILCFVTACLCLTAAASPMDAVKTAAEARDEAAFVSAVNALPDTSQEYRRLKEQVRLIQKFNEVKTSSHDTAEAMRISADYSSLLGEPEAELYQKLAAAMKNRDMVNIFRCVSVVYGRHGQTAVTPAEMMQAHIAENTPRARRAVRRLEHDFWRKSEHLMKMKYLMRDVAPLNKR